jgi:Glycosyl hydrolase-like 10
LQFIVQKIVFCTRAILKILSVYMKQFDLPLPRNLQQKFSSLLALTFITATLTQGIAALGGMSRVQAQSLPFCQFPPQSSAQKETLLRASTMGDKAAQQQYQSLLSQDAQQLKQCRSQSWLKTQAIWLRLYDCDLRPGVLDSVLDRIVSRGYNQVYIEVFYSGQVLLPPQENRTVWPSVVRNPEFARRDLLAEAIQKAKERGLSAYAWLFSLNYGYSYGTRSDRAAALARNGYGKTTLTAVDTTNTDIDIRKGDVDTVFVDPYNPQVRQDYSQLLQAVLQRRPDGVLFDYIRYPKQPGSASVVAKTQDLWIFGNSAQQTLIARATNPKGEAVIQKYLAQGTLSAGDLAAFDKQYPGEEPLWQGRTVPELPPGKPLPPAGIRLPRLLQDLWLLSVAHAYQGVVDFLSIGVNQARQQGIPSGAVFFPDGNRRIKQGFDSRMQPWNQFPTSIEWHPMSYGTCSDSSCIVEQAQRVANQMPQGTKVSPVIAGTWTTPAYNRPSLEMQMNAIHQGAPQISSISHFDFSWQEPLFSNARRSCKVNLTQASAPLPVGFGQQR